MVRRWMAMGLGVLLAGAAPAAADFLGLVIDSFPANEPGLTVFEVFAHFSDADDMVILVGANSMTDMVVRAHGSVGDGHAFHQELVGGDTPMTQAVWEYFPEARRDSFVTIGQRYSEDEQTTQTLPGFDSAAFNNLGSAGGEPPGGPVPVGEGVLWADSSHGGWMNWAFSEPGNDGIAGPDGLVLLMRLVVTDDTSLTGSGGIVYAAYQSSIASLQEAVWSFQTLPPTLCPPDVNGDGFIDVLDLLAVLAAWRNAGGPEDINGDGLVDILDLLAVISAWGTC